MVDIYAYGDSAADGIEVSRRYFSALDELLSRESASEALTKYGLTTANRRYAMYNSDSGGDSHDLFIGNALLDIFEYVNENVNATYLDGAVVNGSYIALNNVNSVPYSSVDVYIYEEIHTNECHDAMDQVILDTYAVTRVSRGTCRYNCHSYAWYSQSTSNTYWIPDPTPFMDSGNYTRKYIGLVSTPASSTSVRYGDIIFYGDVNGDSGTWHSAIYISQSNTPAPLATHRCISKWGSLGVFEHAMSIVPAEYDTSIITAWRGA